MGWEWGKDEADREMDRARLNGEVVLMDWDYKEKLEMEEYVLEPKMVFNHGEDLEILGFTARCSWCVSMITGTTRHAHTENVESGFCAD